MVSEVMVYDHALSDEERQQVEYSLSEKYGIEGNFSGGPIPEPASVIVWFVYTKLILKE